MGNEKGNFGIVVFIIVLACLVFLGGVAIGRFVEHRSTGLVADDLRREVDLGRVGFIELQKKNSKLLGLYQSARETTNTIRGLVESGERDLAKGISTIREAIVLVREIRSRNSAIKKLLGNKELDYRGAGSLDYPGVSDWAMGWQK